MKLRLPILLLGCLIACYSNTAFSVDIITINDDPLKNYWYKNVNLNLNGDHVIPQSFIRWNAEDDSIDEYHFYGNGILSFEHPHYYEKDGDFFISGNGKFNIHSGIILRNTQLDVANGARATFNGSISNTDGLPTTFCVYSPSEYQSTLDITNATIQDNDYVILEFEAGCIIRNNFTVSKNHNIEVWGLPRGASDNISIFDGDLTLSRNGRVTFGTSYGATRDYYPFLSVTGDLIITGNTTIEFLNPVVQSFITPNSGSVIFYCNELSGDLSQLTLIESAFSDNYDGYNEDTVERVLIDKKLVSFIETTPGPAGLTAIMIVDADGKPENPGTIITDGKASGILSDQLIVSLSSGHTVDATEVTDGLNNYYVKGNGGFLITSQNQTFSMNGSDTIGFSMIGTQDHAAANIIIGKENGSISDAAINLVGEKYLSKNIDVKSGILIIGLSTTLGIDDSSLIIGSSGSSNNRTHASVNNSGTINGNVVLHSNTSLYNSNTIKGDVEVNASSILVNNGSIHGSVEAFDGSIVKGTGSFNSLTTLHTGALLYVGNSPGFQSHQDLTVNSGSRLGFYVDGLNPAAFGNSGNGTYSNITVNGTLTLNGMPQVEVGVGLGMVTAVKPDGFSLTLLKIENGGTVIDHSTEHSINLILDDDINLLEFADCYWDSTTQSLIFTGKVDETVAASITGKDAVNIANALWSSTHTVTNFAKVAASQLQLNQPGSRNFWVAGLGDFMSMSSSGNKDGFDYNGGGYSLGADYTFTDKLRLGIAFGQTFGTFKTDDKLTDIDQKGIMSGLYVGYTPVKSETRQWNLSGYFAYGSVENKAKTHIANTPELPGHAKWDDDVFSFGILSEWSFKVTDRMAITPFTGIDYVHGSQDSFNETFDGGYRRYHDGRMQVWSIPVGIKASTMLHTGGKTMLIPELSLSYAGDLSRQSPTVKSSLGDIESKAKGTSPGRNAFVCRAGSHFIINDNWSLGAFYNLEARSKQVNQSAALSASYTF